MGRYAIAVLPGDGIGPEVIAEAVKVLRAVQESTPGLKLDFTDYEAGARLWLRTSVALPDEVFEACQQADAILLGAFGLPDVRLPDGTEAHGEAMFRLRFQLDLYAGVRPIKLYPGVKGALRSEKPIDYVIVRENCEGLYASRGGGCLLRGEVATDTLIVTRNGTRKVASYAFKLARKRSGRPSDGKKVVTCVDKSNVLRSYAFFRKVYDEVAAEYPEIGRDYAYVDAMTAWQVLWPEQYDVVVAENMFGDIISDLAAATVGGMGMAPSADVGDCWGLFQPSHGTAPTIAGKGIANPIATILSGRLMLEWLAERNADSAAAQAAEKIERATEKLLAEGKVLTPDLGGSASTSQVADAIAAAVS
mgnify:CR=1 FL=1